MGIRGATACYETGVGAVARVVSWEVREGARRSGAAALLVRRGITGIWVGVVWGVAEAVRLVLGVVSVLGESYSMRVFWGKQGVYWIPGMRL